MEMTECQQLVVAIDVGIGRLFKGQLHIEAKRLASSSAPVGGLHDSRPSACHDLKARSNGLSGYLQGELVDRVVFRGPC